MLSIRFVEVIVKLLFRVLSLLSFVGALLLIPLALMSISGPLRARTDAGGIYLDVFLLLGGIACAGLIVVFRHLARRQ